MNINTKQLKKRLTAKPKADKKPVHLLSTGSTVLNLACSGRRGGGFPEGTYVFLVGDSESGKSFLSMTCFAEAKKSDHFKNHRLVYNNSEGGVSLLDIRKFFGDRVADNLEWRQSETVEELYDDLDDLCEEGKPFIYVQDSMDSLTSEPETEKFAEQKKARRKGNSAAGSYGADKAKKNSSGLPRVLHGLRKTGSILIIICQTRDNIGFGSQFNPKTRSGGKALRFYATLELWSSIKGQIKRKERSIGITCQIEVKKNRLNGKKRVVEIPLYQSMGMDDVGGCVNYLIKEKHWKKSDQGIVKAPEFGFSGTTEKLIRQIEDHDKEPDLRKLVAEVWQEIEDACEIKRKRRYE